MEQQKLISAIEIQQKQRLDGGGSDYLRGNFSLEHAGVDDEIELGKARFEVGATPLEHRVLFPAADAAPGILFH